MSIGKHAEVTLHLLRREATGKHLERRVGVSRLCRVTVNVLCRTPDATHTSRRNFTKPLEQGYGHRPGRILSPTNRLT